MKNKHPKNKHPKNKHPKNKHPAGGSFQAKPPPPLAQKEALLSAQIAEHLRTRGIYSERLNGGGRIATKSGYQISPRERGTPDRLAIVRGQAIFIETKISEKKPTPEQLAGHDELRDAGAIVIVAASYEQFIDAFAAIRAALFDLPRTINFYD